MFEDSKNKKAYKTGCSKCLVNDSSILDNIKVVNHFQPIISSTKNKLIGYESLCRGVCEYCGCLIPPLELFKRLKDEYEFFNLDLKARKNAVEFFNKALAIDNELLLFINFDANLIEKKIDSPQIILDLCRGTNIRPNNLIIEITESKPCSLDRLMEFVSDCRKQGFLIALDDVGTGYSNFDRITAIKPDIIKLDRSIIENVDKDYHKKVIFRLMSGLAGKMGILLLAEGVETEEEVIYSLELGTDLLQGFYFSKPKEIDPENQPTLKDEMFHIEQVYKEYKINKIKDLKDNSQTYDKVITLFAGFLSEKKEVEFDDFLAMNADKYDFIESLYVINDKGIQITDSHLNCNLCRIKPKIYKIFKKGDSHYYKEYFYFLQENIVDKFTTNTYFSYITGGLCKTISLRFHSAEDKTYVICMNIKG